METYLNTRDEQKAHAFHLQNFKPGEKAICNRAISWLYFSGIIGFCAKITEMDILDFKPASRCYFMDLGVANYYLRLTGTEDKTETVPIYMLERYRF